jgi:hypothetical protein
MAGDGPGSGWKNFLTRVCRGGPAIPILGVGEALPPRQGSPTRQWGGFFFSFFSLLMSIILGLRPYGFYVHVYYSGFQRKLATRAVISSSAHCSRCRPARLAVRSTGRLRLEAKGRARGTACSRFGACTLGEGPIFHIASLSGSTVPIIKIERIVLDSTTCLHGWEHCRGAWAMPNRHHSGPTKT